MAKAKRNVGREILDGLRELKRGEYGRVINVRVINVPSVSLVREKTGLSQSRFAALTSEPTRRQAILSVVGAFAGLAAGRAWAAPEDGISHTADSIHQEPVFTASPKRVYEALTDATQFTRVIQLSGALQEMHLPDQPAVISREEGGAFALYGGFITGRHIELVPNVRVVQAWRAGDWPAGAYSIAKFELLEQGSGCKIAFDHTGFPKGDAKGLASGWKAHYWEPLAKVLA